MPQANCLQIASLSSRVNNKRLIDNLSLDIPAQTKLALVGLNGAGKTSLIRLLVGADNPEQGSISFAGYDPRELAFKDCLGYQPTAMHALPNLSCYEYLRLCCQTKQRLKLNSAHYIDEVVQQWHLEDIKDSMMSRLSQGNLQKVAIAQAFLGQPEYIFLDEPTQALDPIEQQRFINNLQQVKHFQLCMFSSHHISEAVQMADKVLLLHHGRMIGLLNLQATEEYWLVSALADSTINELVSNKMVTSYNQRKQRRLIKISPLNESEWKELGASLSSLDDTLELLGQAQTALMPLFTLLANEAL